MFNQLTLDDEVEDGIASVTDVVDVDLPDAVVGVDGAGNLDAAQVGAPVRLVSPLNWRSAGVKSWH